MGKILVSLGAAILVVLGAWQLQSDDEIIYPPEIRNNGCHENLLAEAYDADLVDRYGNPKSNWLDTSDEKLRDIAARAIKKCGDICGAGAGPSSYWERIVDSSGQPSPCDSEPSASQDNDEDEDEDTYCDSKRSAEASKALTPMLQSGSVDTSALDPSCYPDIGTIKVEVLYGREACKRASELGYYSLDDAGCDLYCYVHDDEVHAFVESAFDEGHDYQTFATVPVEDVCDMDPIKCTWQYMNLEDTGSISGPFLRCPAVGGLGISGDELISRVY